MKKTLLTLALIATISTATFSQAKFVMGVKGGLNLSSVDAKASAGETYKSSAGYHGGLFGTIKIAKIGIQPEILFSKQGYITENAGVEQKFDQKYVNIPVMIKWYFAKVINIQVGPQFGMLTSAAVEAADGTKTDQKSTLKSSDISLCAGFGLELPFKLNFDARYVLGLSDVNDTAGATSAVKNRTVQLSLGYRFLDKGN